MRNVYAFIVRYHFVLLFLILEIFSLVLLTRSAQYQQSIVVGAGNRVAGAVYALSDKVGNYFKLGKVNESLAMENAILRQMKSVSFMKTDTSGFWIKDTLYRQQYHYVVAEVIHNTVGKRSNYIMLNKGRKHGIEKDMAVINPSGVVGTVVGVSDNFSWVMSVLNRNTRISAKITSSNEMGTVVWNGLNPAYATLTDIPGHVKMHRGDTIVTSGYSFIFPSGILLGIVQDFRVDNGERFYTIPFRLSVDFNALQYVYVVKNLMKEEQEKLEQTTEGVKDE